MTRTTLQLFTACRARRSGWLRVAPKLMEHRSLSNVDVKEAFGLLLADQGSALVAAEQVARRMRAAPRTRDPDGLEHFQRILGLVKVTASYLGRNELRNVAFHAERVVDRLLSGASADEEVALALEAALHHIVAEVQAIRAEALTDDLAHNALTVCEELARCSPTLRGSMVPGGEFVDLFKEDAVRHLELCRDALIGILEASDLTSLTQEAFRAIHTFKGDAGMLGFTELEDAGRAVEDGLQGLRSGTLALTPSLSTALLSIVDLAAASMQAPELFRWRRESQDLERGIAEARMVAKRTLLGDLLVENKLVTREQVELVLAIKREPLGRALVRLNALSDGQLEDALQFQRKLRADEEGASMHPPAPNAARAETLQVEVSKIDRLRARAATLSAQPHLPADLLAELSVLRESIDALGRTAIRSSFEKVKLLMTDLARQQGKRLVLSTRGEDVEIPRALLPAIGDALIHLARNAVDHGIEVPAERLLCRKREEAQVTLRASIEVNHVVIEIADDGRGIDRHRILQKAVAAGLVEQSGAAQLQDENVLALVFAPGLSTADAVSNISGRGVGMDAVKHSVESAGGAVRIASDAGRGTRVTMTFPLE